MVSCVSPLDAAAATATVETTYREAVREMIFVLMIQRTGFGNGDASDLRAALQTLAVEALGE